MSSGADNATADRRHGLSGWTEATLFAIALAVLNVSYGYGHQIGAHPIVFIAYAMPIAALTLLLITGRGPHWRAIVTHPLSYVVGGGIIAMEAVYYVLLEKVSPTDGSLLVRLNVPVGILLGFLLLGRRPTRLTTIGALVVVGSIAIIVPGLESGARWWAIALATICAVIISLRSFATEMHPWNRAAHTVIEKMRVTGLVLLVSSVLGLAVIGTVMTLVAHGVIDGPAWLPRPHQFLHLPTYLLALFMGGFVLTAMQYLGFSTVVKIRTENFLAMTALIPTVTLVMQIGAVALGVLEPTPVDWRTIPSMLVMMAGVVLVIWGGRTVPSSNQPATLARPDPTSARSESAREPSTSPAATVVALAPSSPPTRAWPALVGATLLGLPFGTIYAFSVLLNPLETLLSVPRTELSFVFGLSAIGFTIGMNLAPLLFRYLSAPLILAIATVVNIAGMSLAAMARGTFDLALGYGIMFGIASGMAFTTYQQGVNFVVRGRQGLANGYIVSLFPAGAMIGAPLLDWAIGNWGVRAALGGLAAVFGVVGVLSIALFIYGRVAITDNTVSTRHETAGENSGRRVVFWKIFTVFFVAAAAGLMVLSQAAGIIAAYGGAGPLAVFATTGITGAIAAARLTGGWLTDRFPVPHVMAGAQVLALIGTIVLTVWPDPYVSVVTLAMIGIGYGIISGSTAAAIPRYWKRNDFGRIASRLYIAWCIAAVTLPVLAARLFDLTGGYAMAVVVAGIGNLAGVLVAATLPRRSANEGVASKQSRAAASSVQT
jgi:MFS transporter, OFA family, oxalate/formate antiporter